MRVTMNIFSGRPNPTWTLTPPQARELIERVTAAPAPTAADEPPVLGFRGFTVDAELEDVAVRAGVPAHFVVPPPPVVPGPPEPPRPQRKGRAAAAARPSKAHRAAAMNLSQWLLSTAAGVVDDEVLQAAEAAMHRSSAPVAATQQPETRERRTARAATDETVARALADAACEPFLMPVHAGFWNYPTTRFRNNCYNYATNFASNTMAQPGRRSGHHYTTFECGNVATAAEFDGYLAACRGTVRVVALGIWPGFDFHWWRLHPAGFWAHKIGTSPVTQRDNLGRVLGNGLTPENCDRGPYSVFCGFFFAPLGVEVL